MADQAKNALIGVFVVTACAIAILLLLFIHPRVGDEGRILHVRFANIDKVNLGTRVTYAGNPVGEVVEIKEVLPPQNPRPDHEGFVYPYELTLRVDTSVHVYNSDTVSLRTSGLLGEKSVAITPLPPAPGQTLQLVDDKVIYAYETGSVEETLKEFKELADKFESALEAITTTFSDINKSHLVDNVSKTFENIQNITKAIDQPEKYKQLLDNANTFADKAVKSIDKFDKTLETIDQTAANFKEFSATGVKIGNQMATVMDKVVAGEGTIGRLFMKDDLYLRTTSILSKAETLADDVNHYGLLFHLDKDWQKLRARRANLLQKLSTPQQFRNYFNDEIDRITTSLARVSQVMQETECIDPYGELGEDQNFKKVFSELLRRVTALEESLQMYNQQLEEVSVQETELTPSPMEYCQ
jgi:phospholipid/cholesterol/gamma-HCH transport system substrate-binding protein